MNFEEILADIKKTEMRVRRMQSRFNSGDLNTHANALTLQRLKTKLKALRDKLPKLKLVHDNETKNT